MDDERLRSALRHLSESAPDPHGVLDGLAARSRALRARRRLLVAAGGMAVIAPVAVLRPWRRDSWPRVPAPPAVPSSLGDVLPFNATWLPEDAAEYFRSVMVAGPDVGTMERGWRVVSAEGELVVKLRAVPLDPYLPRTGEPVDVNGADGRFQETGLKVVSWPYSRHVALSVTVLWSPAKGVPGGTPPSTGASRDIALRVARSVRPDGRTTLLSPVRFGWLPAGYRHHRSELGGGSSHWGAAVMATGSRQHSPTITATLATRGADRDDGAVSITVRGRPAWYYRPSIAGPVGSGLRYSYLQVVLDNGLVVRVASSQTDDHDPAMVEEAALVEVANTLTIDDTPDRFWLTR